MFQLPGISLLARLVSPHSVYSLTLTCRYGLSTPTFEDCSRGECALSAHALLDGELQHLPFLTTFFFWSVGPLGM